MSYRACLYGCPVPTSPRLCLAPGLMAGLGAATWPVASLLAPLLLHLLLSLPSLRATSLHRKPGCRSARPRHPDGDSRLKNWMEEAEELPWTGAPAGRSPGISCPPGASRLPPGLGCSRLKSSVGQDRGHATPVPSSSKIPPQPRGYLHAFPWDRPDPKTLDPGHSPAWRGASSPPPRPLTDGLH
ncbi:uncharacterized protein [Physeter macrocephalus]|uniref:Uncharacterized protein isoform X1 n=1 Tax=Physeter macrocephalus TaxID=9755 RepID=A0A455BWM0_PHYMC|nr:uncharacterized protein LOC114487239 isoform X1 [Physeter catodon]|eukprot:XP_028352193.1 uncharacterized protein LOC114487239 isoform X2 [Physeter catodon]